ncbi:sensor histidine kinase [Nitrincola lacisaponensis]|uniref:sensor histidine kinase n=1 Tax=Nitrincola lacisaponensis TaxID=267850 RepID=UPI00068C7579|nr:histidine kinase [Nitrincola lacisaponensis]
MLKIHTAQHGPPLCSSKLVLRATVLAQAVAILLALAPGTLEDRWFRLGLSTLFVQWVTLLSLMILCQIQKRWPHQTPKQLAILALSVLLSCTALVSLVAYGLLTGKGWEAQVEPGLFILHNLLIAGIVGVIGLQFYLMHLERHQRIAAQSRAELDALQARIRPHFLFNSLNTTAELTRQDPEAAEQALLNLSNLFRAALKAGESSHLKAELELADAYLSLESWRLGSRLSVSRQIPEHLPDIPLPTLTLQPLLENAVRYGIESNPSPGTIQVQVLLSEKHLTLLIQNPLPATDAERLKGNGMAIENIRQRLALMYDDRARLTTGEVEGEYRVKLVIPFQETNACAP